MPLQPGQTLTFYELLGPLGAGGMGEVWRARDTRLEREVAIKVLPESLADDQERLRRFEREAKTLASLSHPHIGQIFGVDQAGETYFLALELVPGEDLAERLARGALPVDEALDVCRQIAEGLEAAHEAGVVHRDLKPANVRLTPEGAVKLLDFGLAKPFGPRGARSGSGTAESDSFVMSSEGVVLGTPTYMSPEQARGKPVDRRTDIWAFGCVLFECLSGKRAFGGDSLTDVLAAIVERDPDWSALPAATPPAVRALLARCLTKDPRTRLRDVGEARVLLQGGLDAPGGSLPGAPRPAGARVAAGVLAGLALGAVAVWFARGAAPAPVADTRTVTRSTLLAPPDAAFQTLGDFAGPPVLSPDGTKLAFTATSSDGRNHLWVRSLDTLEAREIPGTDGAYHPFWSPDGRSLGYFADYALRRVDLDGGAPLALTEVSMGKGGSWGDDGTIVYAPNFNGGLYRISASGGEPRPATMLAADQTTHRWPYPLPGGRQVLYFGANHDDLQAQKGVWVADLGGGESRFLLESEANAVFADGYLLFASKGALMAQAYDVEARALLGEPRLLGERARVDLTTWRADFDATASGVLVYEPLGAVGSDGLRWLDRSGAPQGGVSGEGVNLTVNLSPSGRLMACETQTSPNSDVWVHDLAQDRRTKLTLEPSDEGRPVWSPDETRIATQSNRGDGVYRIYVQRADGSDRPRMVYERAQGGREKLDIWPVDWSPDGRWLLAVEGIYGDYSPGRSLSAIDLEHPDSGSRVLVTSEAAVFAQFSPDGRWLSYSAMQGGHEEVYVTAFDPARVEALPAGGRLGDAPRWQVSRASGSQPRWCREGRELDFVRGDSKVVAVPITLGERSVQLGEAQVLFTAPIRFRDYGYDVTEDGERFLVSLQGSGEVKQLVLVSDWRAALAGR